jgi:hypothetical protein
MNRDGDGETPARPEKKEYVRPQVKHSEVIRARAVRCARGNNAECPGGPLTN